YRCAILARTGAGAQPLAHGDAIALEELLESQRIGVVACRDGGKLGTSVHRGEAKQPHQPPELLRCAELKRRRGEKENAFDRNRAGRFAEKLPQGCSAIHIRPAQLVRLVDDQQVKWLRWPAAEHRTSVLLRRRFGLAPA